MSADKKHLQETALFIRALRGNETGFEELYAKLLDECKAESEDEAYKLALTETKAKAEEYTAAKKITGSAWPEFEKFVTEFERGVMAAQAGEN